MCLPVHILIIIVVATFLFGVACTLIIRLLIRKYWTWTGFRYKKGLDTQKETKGLKSEHKETKDFEPTSCNGFSHYNEASQCNGICQRDTDELEIHVEGGKSPTKDSLAEPFNFIDSGVNPPLPGRSQRRNSKLIRCKGNLCLEEPFLLSESKVHLPFPERPKRKISKQEHFKGNVASEGPDSFESYSSAYEGDVSGTSSFNISGPDTQGFIRRAHFSHWRKQNKSCSRETSVPEDGIAENYKDGRTIGEGENRKELLRRLIDRLQETRFYSTDSSASSRASSRRQSLMHSFRGSQKHLKRSKTETDFSAAGDLGLRSENLISYSTEYTENESDIERGIFPAERQNLQKFGILCKAMSAFRSRSTGSSKDTAPDSDL